MQMFATLLHDAVGSSLKTGCGVTMKPTKNRRDSAIRR